MTDSTSNPEQCSITKKIITIVADQLSIDASAISLESKLVENLNADSLDQVELVMRLEEEFGISIPDEDAQKNTSIADMVNYVKERC